VTGPAGPESQPDHAADAATPPAEDRTATAAPAVQAAREAPPEPVDAAERTMVRTPVRRRGRRVEQPADAGPRDEHAGSSTGSATDNAVHPALPSLSETAVRPAVTEPLPRAADHVVVPEDLLPDPEPEPVADDEPVAPEPVTPEPTDASAEGVTDDEADTSAEPEEPEEHHASAWVVSLWVLCTALVVVLAAGVWLLGH